MPTAVAQAPTAPPRPFERAKLLRGGLQVGALLAALGLVAAFAPGLGEIRHHLAHADAGWVAAAVALQVLSCGSYVLLFRPLFHTHGERWASTQRIAWSALAIGSIVPASGAAGLAYGGWALTRDGAEPATVARRSVAFFLIKGSVNFVAVAVLGTTMALGLFGPPVSPWLTAFPAALSTLAIVGVLLLPRLGEGDPRATPKHPKLAVARRTLVAGTREAVAIVGRRDPLVLAGALGYWIFDNAVLWAAFHAFGADVDLSVILLGYLVGQLGGLLPIPGGLGGIDGGLIGTLVVFGGDASTVTAAVLAYRIILFWIPLLMGAVAFLSLRRSMRRPAGFIPCAD